MTHHQSFPAAHMAADLILYPMSDELRQSPDDPLLLAKERRAVSLYFDLLCGILAKHDHEITLDHIDRDPAVGWLIHYRSRDPVTITMLHDIAAGDPGPSDPVELGFLIARVSSEESPSA